MPQITVSTITITYPRTTSKITASIVITKITHWTFTLLPNVQADGYANRSRNEAQQDYSMYEIAIEPVYKIESIFHRPYTFLGFQCPV